MAKKLTILLFLFSFIYITQSKAQGCLRANIAILIDWSSSEQGYEGLLADAAKAFVSGLNISENSIQITLITFQSDATLICPLSGDPNFISNKLNLLYKMGAFGGTYANDAVEIAVDQFNIDAKKRNASDIIIIISDGDIGDMSATEKTLLSNIYYIDVFAVMIGEDIYNRSSYKSELGYKNLSKLTFIPNRVIISSSDDLVKALNQLDLCN